MELEYLASVWALRPEDAALALVTVSHTSMTVTIDVNVPTACDIR